MEWLKNELGALVYSSGECHKIQVGETEELQWEKGKKRKTKSKASESFPQGFSSET